MDGHAVGTGYGPLHDVAVHGDGGHQEALALADERADVATPVGHHGGVVGGADPLDSAIAEVGGGHALRYLGLPVGEYADHGDPLPVLCRGTLQDLQGYPIVRVVHGDHLAARMLLVRHTSINHQSAIIQLYRTPLSF